MSIHVLPGDALAVDFKNADIEGDVVVCRECLIEGDVRGEELEDFWSARADFLQSAYGKDEIFYVENVVAEFEELFYLEPETEVNLWFEYELFCQTNMWFCLYLLAEETDATVYRVAPVVRTDEDVWKGFGGLSADDLRACFEHRIKFGKSDILLGKDLWKAYQNKDFDKLRQLSRTNSECFPKLKEVCEAEIEKQFRPKRTLEKIIAGGETDFGRIFELFKSEEGVYGFGDSQVKRILQEI